MDWFDAAFDATMAYNQIGFFVGGLAVLMIGLICIAGHIFERKTGRVVKGKIAGVRAQDSNPKSQQSNMYFPVFEYMDAEGKAVRAESTGGSSSLSDKIPGTPVEVKVKAGLPLQAVRPGVFLLFLGVAMSLGGAAFVYHALMNFPFTPFSFAGGVLLIGWAGFKIKGIMKPRTEWDSINEFQQRKYNEFLEQRQKVPMISEEEVLNRLQKQDVSFVKTLPISIVLGLALIGGGVWFGKDMAGILAVGIEAPGQVIGMEERYDSNADSGSSYTYYPIVEFQDGNQVSHKFTDKVGSNRPSLRIGDTVTVIFDSGNPDKAMIDRGIWNWALSAALLFAGAFILWLSAKHYGGVRHRKRLY